MTRLATLALVATLTASPLAAQDAPPAAEDGWSLMQEGANLLFDSFRSEMEPALEEMLGAFAGAEPMLRDLIGMMGEVTMYHRPEIQPNGDILIRRKTPAEIAAEPPAGETEL